MGIKVLLPGALTTVQDLGRFGYQQFGIPCSGVMDQRAYRTANALLENKHNEAVLELTLFGGSYQFEETTVIAITGADMYPAINGTPCPMYRPVLVPAGGTLSFGMAKSGCRTYLAVSGGIDVPEVMGSRSTNMKCKIGGYQGRALLAGDVLPIGAIRTPYEYLEGKRAEAPDYPCDLVIRVIEGPQADCFSGNGISAFYHSTYTVSEQSDRMGCRLTGPAIESKNGTDIISDGIVFGSIQVTSSGMPIILLADRQTTGGYAKIATVCTADLPLLAQAKPGDTIRFRAISLADAQALLASQTS